LEGSEINKLLDPEQNKICKVFRSDAFVKYNVTRTNFL